ncbi:Ku protein [Amycolatopsis cihanbeyliensis]|uniref:Non-homologous end joining protein Ku n=1 Tax=Amycolatopsis cihanbeyliensis TaxID=1128664 RepID=A0A542CSE5_AMYCI|nr:Ku protein [Amycolatopsis cihanbeyliensis]TQI93747.1 DNA end-binding protein Ku [Amycolatopsis cihanbeyliensis]
MRAMWKGAVSFGLVSIPIHLYAATESKNINFRQVHEADGGRIQYKRFCSAEDKEVPYAEIAKGYELPDGGMVVLTSADLEEIPLSTSKTIDVLEFVPLEAIDPIYYDRTYYLEPQKAATKPYVLLRDALHKSGQVAVVKVAIRQRESLALLRVVSDVLVMTTMLWPDEVRTPDFAFLQEEPPQVRSQELTMASSLIDSLSDTVFEPEKYEDTYRQALESLIQAKIEGDDTTTAPAAKHEADVTDLLTALQASVSAAKKDRESSAEPAKRATGGSGGAAGRSTASKTKGTGSRSTTSKSGSDGSAKSAAKKPTKSRRSPKSA